MGAGRDGRREMSGSRLSEGDPDELIECPFDPVHLLRRKRMQYHIIKCGKVGYLAVVCKHEIFLVPVSICNS